MKLIKNPIFTFIIGIIISGSVVYAAGQINASSITYTKKDGTDTTVDLVIDDLYDKADSLNPKLLWTNPSPTSSFGAQTISLDLSDYKYVIVVSGAVNPYNLLPKSNVIIPVGNYSHSSSLGLSGNRQSRNAKATTSGVTFANAYWGGETDNSMVIPYKIYGIKGDLNIDIGIE